MLIPPQHLYIISQYPEIVKKILNIVILYLPFYTFELLMPGLILVKVKTDVILFNEI